MWGALTKRYAGCNDARLRTIQIHANATRRSESSAGRAIGGKRGQTHCYGSQEKNELVDGSFVFPCLILVEQILQLFEFNSFFQTDVRR